VPAEVSPRQEMETQAVFSLRWQAIDFVLDDQEVFMKMRNSIFTTCLNIEKIMMVSL